MADDDAATRTAVVFDLDGTLIDSVYQHVLAWREALEAEGIDLPVWSIHRKVGMSGVCSRGHCCGRPATSSMPRRPNVCSNGTRRRTGGMPLASAPSPALGSCWRG